MEEKQTIYDSLGDERIQELVAHFYKKVESEHRLRKLYPADLAPAQERLYLFLVHVFGGPSTYLERRGHPMLRRRHFQWEIDSTLRDTWLECMWYAMDQVPMESGVYETMKSYFRNAANHMVNR